MFNFNDLTYSVIMGVCFSDWRLHICSSTDCSAPAISSPSFPFEASGIDFTDFLFLVDFPMFYYFLSVSKLNSTLRARLTVYVCLDSAPYTCTEYYCPHAAQRCDIFQYHLPPSLPRLLLPLLSLLTQSSIKTNSFPPSIKLSSTPVLKTLIISVSVYNKSLPAWWCLLI